MITGSHNPAEYNGFKVVCGASTIHGEEIQELRRMIEHGDYANAARASEQRPTLSRLTSMRSPRSFSSRAESKWWRTPATAPAGPVMHRILQKLNCDATELFFEMDGRFPNHHPDPTVPENLAALVAEVKAQGADLGIAFDGDTDRIGAVDDQGTVVYGDQLMIIYAREILTRKPGATFIGEVKCSQTHV